MFSSINRISGLSGSGFDTEGTIEKLMQAQRAKYDKMFQKRQTLAWKKEAYREMNTTLAKFRDLSFKMKLQGSFMVKKVYSADENKLTVTAGASAADGTGKIKITQLAEGVNQTSTEKITVSGGNTSSLKNQFGLSGMADGQNIKFKINGKEFTYSSNDVDSKNIYGVVADINGANLGVKASYDAGLDRIFFTTTGTGSDQKIELEDVSGSYVNFLSDKLKMNTGTSIQTSSGAITTGSNIPSLATQFTGLTGTVRFTINGEDFEFNTFDRNIEHVVNKINEQLGGQVQAYYNSSLDKFILASLDGKPVNITDTDNFLTNVLKLTSNTTSQGSSDSLSANTTSLADQFTDIAETISFTINGENFSFDTTTQNIHDVVSEINANPNLAGKVHAYYDSDVNKFYLTSLDGRTINTTDTDGFLNGNLKLASTDISQASSTGITTGSRVPSLADQFATLSGNISFTLEGETFTFNTATKNINDVVNEINDRLRGEIRASYDSSGDKLTLTSLDGTSVAIDGSNGFLTDNLKLTASSLQISTLHGKDAIVYINDMADPIRQSNNSFTVNGITYNLKATTDPTVNNGYVHISVNTDVDKVFDNIKNFMDEYNSLLETLYKKVNETRYRSYPPLTDEQKKEMKEDDIKKWEEKAKSGLLYNDTILKSAIDKVRFNLINPVEGVVNSAQLTAIGIETGGYLEQGKLKFSDVTGDKLKEAIKNNPDGIVSLFTQDGDTDSKQGIARRLQAVMDQAIKDINKVSGLSTKLNDDSILGKQIDGLDKKMTVEQNRLIDKENSYWKKFTAMEKALSRMMNQSVWLSQQLGGGQ